jgi:3-deoxy-D-manno-octulosonate 8-phosphate phosphatase (KDO 8-P phosphatase)
MAFFKEELSKVKAFVFDVDGVLSRDVSPLNQEGEPMRTANVKDGYAIRNAIEQGYQIAIITGGRNENIRKRYNILGVTFIYIGAKNKTECFNDFISKNNLDTDSILFMGDDLPDLDLMELSGVPTCPADAVTEIKLVAKYISDRNGGEGCVRDVIEQVMRSQGKWNLSSEFKQPSY